MDTTQPSSPSTAQGNQPLLSYGTYAYGGLSRADSQQFRYRIPCPCEAVDGASRDMGYPPCESWKEGRLIGIPKPQKEPRPQCVIDALAEYRAKKEKKQLGILPEPQNAQSEIEVPDKYPDVTGSTFSTWEIEHREFRRMNDSFSRFSFSKSPEKERGGPSENTVGPLTPISSPRASISEAVPPMKQACDSHRPSAASSKTEMKAPSPTATAASFEKCLTSSVYGGGTARRVNLYRADSTEEKFRLVAMEQNGKGM